MEKNQVKSEEKNKTQLEKSTIEEKKAQLKAELALLEKQEKEEYAAKKKAYEEYRDKMVAELVAEAKLHQAQLINFKVKVMSKLEKFKEKALEYGDIRSHSKGGFSLRTTDQTKMLVFERNSKPEYDERADMAEALIKNFLQDMVRVKDAQTFRTIEALMSRNSKGDFSTSSIASLLKIKDNYDDSRWIKAMKLFEESYRNRIISNSAGFYEKDENGKDEAIKLTFASL